MNKWITTVVASVFALSAGSGFAQGFKAEELTAEQKAEIRDRVERLKTERAKAETAKPAEPANVATPQRTTKTTKHKAKPTAAKAMPAKTPTVTTTVPRL